MAADGLSVSSRSDDSSSSSSLEYDISRAPLDEAELRRHLLDSGYPWGHLRKLSMAKLQAIKSEREGKLAEQVDQHAEWNGSQGVFRERECMLHEDQLSHQRRAHDILLADKVHRRLLHKQGRAYGAESTALFLKTKARQAQLDLERQQQLQSLKKQEHTRRIKHLDLHGMRHHLHCAQCISQTDKPQPRTKAAEVPSRYAMAWLAMTNLCS